MKISISTLLGILIFANAFCQSIYKSDISPQIDEDYFKHIVDLPDSINPGAPGLNQTWDMSNANFSLQNDYYYQVVDPSTTPHVIPGASYAIKNYPVIDTTYVGYSYYNDTADGFYLMHDFQGIVERIDYSGEFVFKFPMIYGDSIVDSYCYSSTIFGTTTDYCGVSKLKFDGLGTLWLSGISPIPGVYRLKYEATNIRQFVNDTSYITKYFWYQTGIHHPIADYAVYIDGGGLTNTYANIYSTYNTTGLTVVDQDLGVTIYPNPSDASFQLFANDNIDIIQLTDLSGKSIAINNNISGKSFKFETGFIESGIYFVRITSGKFSCTKKVIIQH